MITLQASSLTEGHNEGHNGSQWTSVRVGLRTAPPPPPRFSMNICVYLHLNRGLGSEGEH